MDEAALIEELARALAVADRIEICSDAQYRHSSYGIRAAALLPIIRRIHNEAVEAERARIVATIRDLPACVQGSQTAWIADAIERGQTGG